MALELPDDPHGAVEHALAVGDPARAVAVCAAWLRRHPRSPVDARYVDELIALAIRNEPAWTEQRLAITRALIPAESTAAHAEADKALSRVADWGAGSVLVPLVDESTGLATIRPLKVTCSAWGGGIHIEGAATSPETGVAFWNGCVAAVDLLGAGAEASRARDLQFNGELSGVRARVGGQSIGLGAAIATLSSLTGAVVPESLAFSARVSAGGRLLPVRGMPSKLASARRYGVERLFVAHDQEETDAPLLRRCDTVAAVAHEVFGRIGDWSPPVDANPEVSVERSLSAGIRVVLVSAVGRSDPFGSFRDRQGTVIGRDEGPILGAIRLLRPVAVCLLFTETPDPGNRYRASAEALEQAVHAATDDCRILKLEMRDLTDPTHLPDVLRAFEERMEQVLDAADGHRIVVNVSSGTPQMQIAWHLLVERRRLGPQSPVLVQVRESRWLRPGESRLRTVPLAV